MNCYSKRQPDHFFAFDLVTRGAALRGGGRGVLFFEASLLPLPAFALVLCAGGGVGARSSSASRTSIAFRFRARSTFLPAFWTADTVPLLLAN